eukprot:scaffold123875_cov35-Tisochrysis_lutea.AAC.1
MQDARAQPGGFPDYCFVDLGTLGLAAGGWREGLVCVAMVAMAMVAVVVWGLRMVARAVVRAHL